MSTELDTHARTWSAGELRLLLPAERDAALAAEAGRAVADYGRDPDLTDFEAFGPEDLYGDSAAARAW